MSTCDRFDTIRLSYLRFVLLEMEACSTGRNDDGLCGRENECTKSVRNQERNMNEARYPFHRFLIDAITPIANVNTLVSNEEDIDGSGMGPH